MQLALQQCFVIFAEAKFLVDPLVLWLTCGKLTAILRTTTDILNKLNETIKTLVQNISDTKVNEIFLNIR